MDTARALVIHWRKLIVVLQPLGSQVSLDSRPGLLLYWVGNGLTQDTISYSNLFGSAVCIPSDRDEKR